MWDWLDSAASSVGDLFSSSSSDAASSGSALGDLVGIQDMQDAAGNGALSQLTDTGSLTDAAGVTNGIGDGANVTSDLNIGWNTLGSALKATSGLMGTPKSGIGSGFVTKTTELPGQNRAMGYDPTKNPAQTGAMPSVDPRQTNSWWYNMMKTFAYAGK